MAQITRRHLTAGSMTLPLLAAGLPARTQVADAPTPGEGSGFRLLDIAIDAYIFGYPLATMEMTRRVMTNVAKPEGTRPWDNSPICASTQQQPSRT